jgi:hypothetical protein
VNKAVVLASAVATAALSAQIVRGGTYTENFDIKPIDWKGLNNDGAAGTFGFQTTNLTAQANPAGEAGGTMIRSTTRGYYADTALYGTLTQDDFIHGEGELDFRNGTTGDNELVFGHQNINTLDFNRNLLGIGAYEAGGGQDGVRITYLIYPDAGGELNGTRTNIPPGQYRYTYDWNPVTDNMNVKIFNSGGGLVLEQNSGTLGISFNLNAHGFAAGINSSSNPAQSFDMHVDATSYTTYMPKVTQRFDSSPANWQPLGSPTYGFSNTNNTGQESGAGEAGGVFIREDKRQGYADTNIQALSQAQPFGASGEFSWGLPNSADNELFIAHFAKNQVDGTLLGDSNDPTQGGHNMAGLYILDNGSNNSFRWMARIYDSNAVRHSDDPVGSIPAGTYKFDYFWDPSSLTLTARILQTDGVTVVATDSVTLPSDSGLDLDAFGLTTGFNGSVVPGANYSVFIDNVSYTAGHQWVTDSNGTWGSNNRDSWDGPLPDGNDHVAYFGNKITAARTITLDGGKTVGSIYFNSPNSYTIAGTDTITMEGVGNDPVSINVLAGGHTISAPINLNDDLVVNSAGSGVALTGNVNASGRKVTKLGAGTAQFENVRANSLAVNGGQLSIRAKTTPNDPAGTSVVGSLTISASGVLNLTNNSMIIDYNELGSLVDDTRQHLAAGRLTSSSATLLRGLGYADNAVLNPVKSSFGGQSVDATSLLIKYTYLGDTDLDGDVDVADLGTLATAWQTSGVWSSGDFDYNGSIDVGDLGLLATNWQAGVGNPLGPSLGDALLALGLPSVAVPEPGVLGALGALGILSLRRRTAK